MKIKELDDSYKKNKHDYILQSLLSPLAKQTLPHSEFMYNSEGGSQLWRANIEEDAAMIVLGKK